MTELFKLIKEEFSKDDEEWQCTYSCLFEFTFNYRKINKITITDHPWRKKGREWMTKEMILDIFQKYLNSETKKRHDNREVFIEEKVPHGDKDFLLVFWFEDSNSDWLWVRNCYLIVNKDF